MKKKSAFTFVELILVILIVGVLVAIAVPILRQKVGDARNDIIKNKYYEGVDPNQVQAYKDILDHFDRYLGPHLCYATAEDIEKFLLDYRKPALQQNNLSEAMIEETLQLERKVLMGWVDTAAEMKKNYGW